jgi:hypothetical protein
MTLPRNKPSLKTQINDLGALAALNYSPYRSVKGVSYWPNNISEKNHPITDWVVRYCPSSKISSSSLLTPFYCEFYVFLLERMSKLNLS